MLVAVAAVPVAPLVVPEADAVVPGVLLVPVPVPVPGVVVAVEVPAPVTAVVAVVVPVPVPAAVEDDDEVHTPAATAAQKASMAGSTISVNKEVRGKRQISFS